MSRNADAPRRLTAIKRASDILFSMGFHRSFIARLLYVPARARQFLVGNRI
jgi:hypothetical protein